MKKCFPLIPSRHSGRDPKPKKESIKIFSVGKKNLISIRYRTNRRWRYIEAPIDPVCDSFFCPPTAIGVVPRPTGRRDGLYFVVPARTTANLLLFYVFLSVFFFLLFTLFNGGCQLPMFNDISQHACLPFCLRSSAIAPNKLLEHGQQRFNYWQN